MPQRVELRIDVHHLEPNVSEYDDGSEYNGFFIVLADFKTAAKDGLTKNRVLKAIKREFPKAAYRIYDFDTKEVYYCNPAWCRNYIQTLP